MASNYAELTSGSTSALLGNIYCAALDDVHWANVLSEISICIGGAAAGIWTWDPTIARSHQYQFGGDEEFRGLLFSHYQKSLGQMQQHGSFAGDAVVTGSHTASTEYLDALLAQRADKCTSRLVVYRYRRDDSWDEIALQKIACHLGRAALISHLIDTNRATAAAMADTLDGVAASTFIFDAEGETLYANMSGNAMLAEGRFVRSKRGKLTLGGVDPKLTISEIVTLASSRSVRFCLTQDDTREAADSEICLAQMLPVGPVATQPFGCKRAVVGMIVHQARLNTRDVITRVARHYRLTSRECDVLEAIIDGYGLSKTAKKLGISLSTIKTYLQRLFEKTSTNRSLDLIKLCAAFRSPFVG